MVTVHDGLIRVGPESAGAHPGPVCYGRGGKLVTVTDADLVLGRIKLLGEAAAGHKLDSVVQCAGHGAYRPESLHHQKIQQHNESHYIPENQQEESD